MRTYLFDDVNSYGHAILGLLVALLPWWISVFLLVAFVHYEVNEKENAISTIGDVVEFITGFLVGALFRW